MAYESWRVRVAYTPGVWTDVTGYVDTVAKPISSTSGSTPETTGEPGSLELVLNNTGYRFTPGNTLSALALTSGLPIQFLDTVGTDEFPLFTGFIEFPEIEAFANSANKDQTIRVTAVDLLSRLERSETFVSTLGAHIMSSPPAANLIGYWPLADPVARFASVVTDGDAVAPDLQANAGGPTLVISPQGGPELPGDDVSPLQVEISDSIGSDGTLFSARLAEPITLSGTDALTMILWTRRITDFSSLQPQQVFALIGANFTDVISIGTDFSGGSRWGGAASFNNAASFINPGVIPEASTLRWVMLGMQVTLNPAAAILWVDDETVTGGPTGTIPSSVTLDIIWLANNWCGNVAHAQIYLGPPSQFIRTDFLAQYQVGQYGLDRQTTGQRIRTIAGYAGISDLSQVDPGCSIMSRARLAGQTVAQALYDARDTEQGDLFVDGSGRLTFRDRRTILNV